jgi:hypothetical protein
MVASEVFDTEAFLTTVGAGRTISTYKPKHYIFRQGDAEGSGTSGEPQWRRTLQLIANIPDSEPAGFVADFSQPPLRVLSRLAMLPIKRSPL